MKDANRNMEESAITLC